MGARFPILADQGQPHGVQHPLGDGAWRLAAVLPVVVDLGSLRMKPRTISKLSMNIYITIPSTSLNPTYPKSRITRINLPGREAVVIVQHDHVLRSLAHAVGGILLDEPEVAGELEAPRAGAGEDDAGVVRAGQQGHEVLHGRGRAGSVGLDGERDGLAEGPVGVVLVAQDACLQRERTNEQYVSLTT